MAIGKRGSGSYEAERLLRTIFRRCLNCPDETPPCPSCSDGQICSLVPYDCNACAHSTCVDNPDPSPAPSSGPNVGAIAGGVVGGIAFVGFLVFLVWILWIRKRRAQQEAEAEVWADDEVVRQKAAFQSMHHDAASTRTRGSFANSVLSRASNVIQIAYIPGVTVRNGSKHNSLLADSPVPPVPAARSATPKSPLSNKDDALFFRPSDIRDSSYSNTSSVYDKRDTFARSSLAPSLARTSVTSGAYQSNATTTPMPPVQISRAIPRMVSVKPSSPVEYSPAGSPRFTDYSPASANTSPVETKPLQVLVPGQSSGMSTPSAIPRQGSYGKAHQVTVGAKGKGRFPVNSPTDSVTSPLNKHSPTVSSPLSEAKAGFGKESSDNPTATTPKAQPEDSPFFDASEVPLDKPSSKPTSYPTMAGAVSSEKVEPVKRTAGFGGLGAVIEEATKNASSSSIYNGSGGKRENSPFSDDHRVG